MRNIWVVGFMAVLCLTGNAARQGCVDKLAKGVRSVALVKDDSTVDTAFTKIKDVNTIVIRTVADFFKTKKRQPAADEMASKMKAYLPTDDVKGCKLVGLEEDFTAYYALAGAADDMTHLLHLAVWAYPDRFTAIRENIQKQAATFYKDHLRAPTMDELAAKTKLDRADLVIVIGDGSKFWDAVKETQSVVLQEAKKKVRAAYLAAMAQRTIATRLRTQTHAPTFDEVFQTLVMTESNKHVADDHVHGRFTHEHFKALLNMAPMAVGDDELPMPALFDKGLDDVQEIARIKSPSAFANYRDEERFGVKSAEKTRDAITAARGFIATSVTPGIPLDEGMFAAMLKYAEEMDYPILVYPVAQVTEGLDPRLLDNPRIHIITNTIENAALRVWNIGLMAKNQNPFASLDKRRQFLPGQVILVGHPQLAHRRVATASNHIRATELWSTGSLSWDKYPRRHESQARMSEIAANNHTNSFLVVQKADWKAGPLGMGISNYWHVRPVIYYDERDNGLNYGFFNDMGRRYQVSFDGKGAVAKIDKTTMSPIALGVPDLHDWLADQRMLAMYGPLFSRFKSLRHVYLHDPRDSFSHNRHEEKAWSLLQKKFASGALDWHEEDMGLVRTGNMFQSFRDDVEIFLADSNHSYWGRKLIDNAPESQLVINGLYLTELQMAARIYGAKDPLEWVFHHRNDWIRGLPTEIRKKYEEKVAFVYDPSRAHVLPPGRAKVEGPKYRQVYMNFHGHEGINGGRSSQNAHASAAGNGVFGDSHQPYILGDAFGLGTNLPARIGYNDGGYSSWGHAFVLVYPDGSKQLLSYSPNTGTFEQRSGEDVLPPSEFFGNAPLRVFATDNELLPGVEVTDVYTRWLNMTGVPQRRTADE